MDARVEGMNCPIPEGRPTPPRTGSYSRRAVGASHGAERRARGGARLPRGLWTPWEARHPLRNAFCNGVTDVRSFLQ